MPVATPQPVWTPVVGAPTEAYWAGGVAEGVVQRFATTAERDARWTTPPNGSICVTTNTSPPSMWQRSGSAWVQIGPPVVRAPYTGAQSIAGALTISGMVTLPATMPTHTQHAARKGYVDQQDNLRVAVAGDTMTGPLVLQDAPTNAAHATRRDYVNAEDNKRLALTGGVMTGDLVMVRRPNDGSSGLVIDNGGGIAAAVAVKDNWNITLRRSPAADMAGQQYIRFNRGAAPGSIMGSIAILDGDSIVYNRSSDYRLKEFVGTVSDAAERVSGLARRVFTGRWRRGSGEQDMLNAHDIAEFAPYAVMGTKDALTEDGDIDPQQVDYSGLVPLLVAALGDALDRIVALEAQPA